MLTASSLFLWYKDNGIETRDIVFLTLIAIPYTFKYLWAPFLDKVKIPRLGRRKGCILLTQVLFYTNCNYESILTSKLIPYNCFYWFSNMLCISNTRYCHKRLPNTILLEHERALGNAIAVTGYRIGMLVIGSLVLIIVDRLNNNWNLAWLMITPFFIICPLYILC